MGFREDIGSLEQCSCGREHRLKLLVEISEGALERTPELLEAAGMPKRLHVTADRDTLAAADGLPRLLEEAGYTLSWTVYDQMTSATVDAGRALEAELGDAQGVLAVGTGSVSDVSRVACFTRNLPYAIFGTAPSMDGFASNSAPMIEKGYKRTHYGYQPRAVIADTRILARSPQILKAAGLGDVLGKYIAAADWQVAHLLTGEYFCPNVCRLVEQSARQAYQLSFHAREETPQVAGAIMEALVFPGLAMEFCGTTRPASGAEHYLSHCWEVLFLRDHKPPQFHGRKVGVATVIMADIYKRLSRVDHPGFRRRPIPVEQLRQFYTTIFPEMEKELEADVLNQVDIQRLAQCWPQVQQILSRIPDAGLLAEALEAAGGAVTPEEVQVGAQLARESLIQCRYIRNRLTTFRLMDMLEIGDDFCLEALENIHRLFGTKRAEGARQAT